jgi:hypothetical protein
MKELFQWLADEIAEIFNIFFDAIYNGFAALIALIPVPGFFADATTLMGQLPNDVMYWIYLFQVPFGLSIAVSAYSIRFAIRRIT